MQAVKKDGSLQQRSGPGSPGNEADTSPEEKQGRSRGRSFTFSRGRKDSRSSSKPGKREGSIGRHLRSKSTENFNSGKSASSGSNFVSGMFSNIKPQQGPVDYVSYLRKVQKPELVEVGKIHKLRLLLRNETVSWIEHFIEQGGMKEIVGLLHRIMEVEWRYVYALFILVANKRNLLMRVAERSMKMRCFTKTYCASRRSRQQHWPLLIWTTCEKICSPSFFTSSSIPRRKAQANLRPATLLRLFY